jgi:dolichyl-phosphate beta-glucosyltransferase
MSISILPELKSLTRMNSAKSQGRSAPTLAVSLIIPAKNSHQSLEKTVHVAHEFLSARYPDSFEIILVPNPSPNDHHDQSLPVAQAVKARYSGVEVCPHESPRGKGAALRTGFQSARGRWIFFTDADLPYSLEFFDQAASKLREGYHFVHGNRRLTTSQFVVPVRLLQLAYGRHRLGLWFNRCVRWLLPISTTDTQAGIKALSHEFAREFFSRQTCPGFLFDLEIFLTAQTQGWMTCELPITLHLNSEKSTVRILRECLLVGHWLTRIKINQLQSRYGVKKSHRILTRYQKVPLTTRVFLTLRWWLTPYTRMAQKLPIRGEILDLGCGHGLFALAASLHSPDRKITGLDHDESRIAAATQATQDLPNLDWKKDSLLQFQAQGPFAGISLIDVMHYFSPTEQESLLRNAYKNLHHGATLLVREVDPQAGAISQWNRLYERLATGLGFTRSDTTNLHFRTQDGWKSMLESIGFKVASEPCSSPLFADILYVCTKPSAQSNSPPHRKG